MRRFREWISNDLICISKKMEDDGSSVTKVKVHSILIAIIIGGIIGIIFRSCLFFS